MTTGKWRIVGVLLIGTGLAAALPFQRAIDRPRSGPAKMNQADFVWRRSDDRPAAATPISRSQAAELFIQQPTDHASSSESRVPRVSRPASLDAAALPPELPPVYAPHVTGVAATGATPPKSAKSGDGREFQRRVVRHRIVDGDSLARLAARYLGNDKRWLEIYEENRDVLESPDLLPIKVELVIVVRPAELVHDSSGSPHGPLEMVPIDSNQWKRAE